MSTTPEPLPDLESEYLPDELHPVEGLAPGDEVHHDHEWREVVARRMTAAGVLIKFEDREVLAEVGHLHRARRLRPRPLTVSR